MSRSGVLKADPVEESIIPPALIMAELLVNTTNQLAHKTTGENKILSNQTSICRASQNARTTGPIATTHNRTIPMRETKSSFPLSTPHPTTMSCLVNPDAIRTSRVGLCYRLDTRNLGDNCVLSHLHLVKFAPSLWGSASHR